MIEKLLTEEFVAVDQEADNWEESIKLAGELLLKNGCIETEYIDCIINAVKDIGPYIVIGPGMALAHARPEEGVKKLCLSMVTLKTPVYFGDEENDPVKLVIGMGAVDNTSHIEVISDMAGLLCEEENLEKIYAAKSPEELVETVASLNKK